MRPWPAGWKQNLSEGHSGCGSGKPGLCGLSVQAHGGLCGASYSPGGVSRAFCPGGTLAGRRDVRLGLAGVPGKRSRWQGKKAAEWLQEAGPRSQGETALLTRWPFCSKLLPFREAVGKPNYIQLSSCRETAFLCQSAAAPGAPSLG